MKHVKFLIPIILIMLLAALFAPSRIKGAETAGKTALIMGTVVEIRVPVSSAEERAKADAAIEKALAEERRIESVFSVFRPGSEVSKINALRKGTALVLTPETFRLIERSVEFSNLTDGAFDITVKPLIDLWAHAKADGAVPSDAAVLAALERVGSRDLILDRTRMTIEFGKDGMSIDLGAIAKGYATDRAVAVLKGEGIANAIVISGGDVYCLGMKAPNEPWKVGIRHPRDKEKLFMELALKDMAVDTAGDYEKYFIAGGKRYSHIIDPRTGYPIGDDVISASIIARDATSADALATAACVLGRNAMNILDASSIDAIIVYKENGSMRISLTDRVKERYGAREVAPF